MEALVQTALLRHSTAYQVLDAGVLAELVDVAAKIGADPESLASSFDRYMTIKRFGSTSVSLEDVENYALEERISSAKALADRTNKGGLASKHGIASSHKISPFLSTKTAQEAVPRTLPAAPLEALHGPLTAPPAASQPANREPRQHLISSYNPDLPTCTAGAAPGSVRILGAPLAPGWRLGGDRLELRAAYIEGRIAALEDVLCGLDDAASPSPVGTACQETSLFVGRICCDSEEGRLNPQSLLLEGSMRLSAGARVRLDASHLASCRLFPGQVAAVRGVNPSGHCIIAQEVLGGEGMVRPASPATPLAPTSLVVAAGPYCGTGDLDYAPLHALLAHCRRLRPAFLLLAGPWVDEGHPLLGAGLVEETFQSIFETRVLAPLSAFALDCPGTRVLLPPSPRDLHLSPVFPQPTPALRACDALTPALRACASLTPLPNPATLELGSSGLVAGVVTADWLLAAGREELAVLDPSAGPVDRLASLAAHITSQRSYFPLFPPPPGLALDCAGAGAALRLPADAPPALLILPSDLAPLARPTPCEGTLVVNPGRAARGPAAGTFAHVCATGGAGEAGAPQRLRVDLLRV